MFLFGFSGPNVGLAHCAFQVNAFPQFNGYLSSEAETSLTGDGESIVVDAQICSTTLYVKFLVKCLLVIIGFASFCTFL